MLEILWEVLFSLFIPFLLFPSLPPIFLLFFHHHHPSRFSQQFQALHLSNFISIISILYLYFLSLIYLCIPMLPLPFLYSSNLVFLLFVFLPFSFTPFMLPFLTYFSLNLPFIHVSQYFPLTYLFSFFATPCSPFCSFRIILFFLTLLIDSYFFF